ncbi:PrsW family intramembrane metalloprotease [Mycobacteroides abscessus]|uniref:PrsW family intramembrane metalloprotease n=1 Tax=Mycobacteroides abscessus TaxID=36809 RepID=UPI000C25CCD7|nr:PrsW family intramembrane metalloprotease [Mycobacteroides abscessus]
MGRYRTRPGGRSYSSVVSYAPAPTPLPPMPGFGQRIKQVGAPIGVIIALALVTGLIITGLLLSNPVGAMIGLVLSSVAIGIVVLCYLWLDRWEPEPSRLLVLAFVWGASLAVVVSIVLEMAFGSVYAPDGSTSFASIAIRAPFIEEAAKGAFLLLMLTGRRRHELNSLTDCLVYAGITAAGFAWLEDIAYIGSGNTVGESVLTAIVRLGLGPFAHSLFTSMTGVGVYYALRRRDATGKFFRILAGYLAAVVMHGLWNGSSFLGLKGYLAVYVLWMVPMFVLMIVVGVRSRRREQHVVAGKLPGMVAAGLITPNEATWLGSLKERKHAIAAARRIGGAPGRAAVKNFAAQVVELAFVRDRIERGSRDPRDVAMQTEEAYAVMAARAAAPILQALAGYRASLSG